MTLIKPLILFILILNCFGISKVHSQDTLFVFPSAKEIDTDITIQTELFNGSFSYKYKLESTELSDQDIFQFFIETDSELTQITSPQGWRGNISEARKRVVFWSTTDSIFYINPSDILDGYLIESNSLPAPVSYYIRGRFERPKVPEGEAPPLESIDGADIFENSVRGKTIGPKVIPENTTNKEMTDTLSSYVTQSCDLGWIENQGICRSLQAKLDNVKRQLEQGNTQTAANNLQAFLNEVEAIKDQQLSSEAYALLRFNGEYLLGKLREE